MTGRIRQGGEVTAISVMATGLAIVIVVAALALYPPESVAVNLLTGAAETIIAVTLVASLLRAQERRVRAVAWERALSGLRYLVVHRIDLLCYRLWADLRGATMPIDGDAAQLAEWLRSVRSGAIIVVDDRSDEVLLRLGARTVAVADIAKTVAEALEPISLVAIPRLIELDVDDHLRDVLFKIELAAVVVARRLLNRSGASHARDDIDSIVHLLDELAQANM